MGRRRRTGLLVRRRSVTTDTPSWGRSSRIVGDPKYWVNLLPLHQSLLFFNSKTLVNMRLNLPMFPGNLLNVEGSAMDGVVNVVVVHDVLQAVSKFLLF